LRLLCKAIAGEFGVEHRPVKELVYTSSDGGPGYVVSSKHTVPWLLGRSTAYGEGFR